MAVAAQPMEYIEWELYDPDEIRTAIRQAARETERLTGEADDAATEVIEILRANRKRIMETAIITTNSSNPIESEP